MEEKLRLGVAYHGNRMTSHVRADMADIARHGMNLVVHMFSYVDWTRHAGVMKEILDASEENGLETWVDFWGLGGPPGDASLFPAYHPEARQIYADGTPDPVSACYNSEAYVAFAKEWIDAVHAFGGKAIFWDEPQFKKRKDADGNLTHTCFCPTCRELFRERYGKPMPTVLTPEVEDFRVRTVTHFFEQVTDYSASLGMENIACVMLDTVEYTRELVKLPHLDDFGIDPYWNPPKHEPFDLVYDETKKVRALTGAAGKKSHIWVQGFHIPRGHEDEMILAADAAYEAGARTILFWSYRGAESNTYRSECPEAAWNAMGEAAKRVRNRWFDDYLTRKRAEKKGERK